MKILFVCQANVGRSQMAEGFYNSMNSQQPAISAGVDDFREKYKHHPTQEIIDAMKEVGIDISDQKMDVLTPEMCDLVDRVVVLCSKDLCPGFLLQHENAVFHEIEDPHQKSPETIRQVRDEIRAYVEDIVSQGDAWWRTS